MGGEPLDHFAAFFGELCGKVLRFGKGFEMRLSLQKGSALVFVGNDVNDLSAMQIVGFSIAVADAHDTVKAMAWTVLETAGGDGVAREIVEQVLELFIPLGLIHVSA